MKKAVWDGVHRTNVGPLIFRVLQGSITNITSYSLTKYLSLTLIDIVNSLGSPLTVFLGYLLLKERLALFEGIMYFLTVASCLTFAAADVLNEDDSSHRAKATETMTIVMYVALCFNPILSAFGTIAMRKMKKFHEAIVSFYLNIGIGLTALLMILIMDSGFEAIRNFDWISWVLCLGTGLTGVAS